MPQMPMPPPVTCRLDRPIPPGASVCEIGGVGRWPGCLACDRFWDRPRPAIGQLPPTEPALAGPTGDATADLAALRRAARRDHPAADPARRCLIGYRAACSCGAWVGIVRPTEMDAMIEHDGHRTRDVRPKMPDCGVCGNELDADRYCHHCHAQR